MRSNIHPKWYPEAQVICACGHTWKVGATVETIRTDVCSNCHPFFTGQARIVDTEGQVDRFYKRLDRAVTTGGEGRGKRAQRRKERRSIVEIVEDETEGQPASTAA
jgi:large subunit ribosomal protein L31